MLDHTAMGEALRTKRKTAKLSLRVVAKAMGISAMYLCDMERGRRLWSADRIKRFESALIDRSLLSPAVHVKLDLTKPQPNRKPKAFV